MWVQAYCDFPFNRARITSEGWVSMCCFMRPDPLKPLEDAYIGNVFETPFDEIWFGDVAESIRKSTLEGELHSKCNCPGCPYLRPDARVKRDIVYNEHPNFLEIDLPNTHCNVGGLKPDPIKSPACVMCERSDPNFIPEEDHLMEVLDKIKHIMPNLCQMHIQGIAEPFYQTREKGYLLFDVMDKLEYDKYKNDITISVTTNATLFKESVRREYLDRAPKSITNFSVDAATPETFKAIRIFDCFDKVWDNIYAFDAERTRDQQFIRIHNNINLMNIHEVRGMVQLAAKAHVEYVEFNPTNGFNHKILVNEDNCGLFTRAEREIIEECELLGVQYNFIRPLDLGLTQQNLIQIML